MLNDREKKILTDKKLKSYVKDYKKYTKSVLTKKQYKEFSYILKKEGIKSSFIHLVKIDHKLVQNDICETIFGTYIY